MFSTIPSIPPFTERGLCMAVGTDQPQIDLCIVVGVAIDVIHFQRNWLPHPFRFKAMLALIRPGAKQMSFPPIICFQVGQWFDDCMFPLVDARGAKGVLRGNQGRASFANPFPNPFRTCLVVPLRRTCFVAESPIAVKLTTALVTHAHKPSHGRNNDHTPMLLHVVGPSKDSTAELRKHGASGGLRTPDLRSLWQESNPLLPGTNRRHHHLCFTSETAALPNELDGQAGTVPLNPGDGAVTPSTHGGCVEPQRGIEPLTSSLRMMYSTS